MVREEQPSYQPVFILFEVQLVALSTEGQDGERKEERRASERRSRKSREMEEHLRCTRKPTVVCDLAAPRELERKARV